MFRGFLSLNGQEIINSARVAAHLGLAVPTTDADIFDTADCALTPAGAGLYEIPATSQATATGLYSPPAGSRLYDPGLIEVGDCWPVSGLCGMCHPLINYDDSWPGLRDYLGDTIYRPELAPWYSVDVPESAEFAGVWLLKAEGFDPVPVERPISELIGDGAAAGPHRDASRKLVFTAVLIGCTNAGVTYGLHWLACQLRDTNDRTDSVLRYFAGHPGDTLADPDTLLRELHAVVLTKAPTIDEQFLPGSKQNRQATMYAVSFEMVALRPHAYLPAVTVPVTWRDINSEPITWVHAAYCAKPESCAPMPVLFSQECEPQLVDLVTDPPPSCGGCMPVCEIDTYVFPVPTMAYPLRCTQTAACMTVTNTGETPVSLQAWWRIAGSDTECEDNRWPLQVAGLPAGVTLSLDAIAGRFYADVDGRRHRPVGIVSTPNGAPWRPAIIDRAQPWELVVLAAPGTEFQVGLTLADREA